MASAPTGRMLNVLISTKLSVMKKTIYIVACTALLTGCKQYSNYERPEELTQGIEKLYRDTTATYQVVQADTTNFGNTPWQKVFTDAKLQSLIRKALENNLNLQSTELNIEQSKQALKIARLAYLPSLTLGGQGTATSWDYGKATQTYSFPLTASWQIGALGSKRNIKKQAQANLEYTKEYRQAVRTSLIAGVANLYYTLQMLDEQLKTTKETVEIWKENVRVMEAMKVGGMTTEAAVGQARANYYQLEASIPVLEENIRQAENSLCTLLAEPAHSIERNAFAADGFPASYSTGIPLQLLANRPDVRAAEAQIAASFYNINVARSSFYPSLTITGQAAWTNSYGLIVNPGKILASAIASFSQTLFANGQLTAQLKVSKLQYENTLLQFRNTLLNAGNEVSNALSAYQSAQLQETAREKQVEQLNHTLEQTQMLFTHTNQTTYLEVLTAQQSLIQAQLNLISVRFDKVQAGINLYQALGGGREK